MLLIMDKCNYSKKKYNWIDVVIPWMITGSFILMYKYFGFESTVVMGLLVIAMKVFTK